MSRNIFHIHIPFHYHRIQNLVDTQFFRSQDRKGIPLLFYLSSLVLLLLVSLMSQLNLVNTSLRLSISIPTISSFSFKSNLKFPEPKRFNSIVCLHFFLPQFNEN